jgi:hypothetical protein
MYGCEQDFFRGWSTQFVAVKMAIAENNKPCMFPYFSQAVNQTKEDFVDIGCLFRNCYYFCMREKVFFITPQI